MGGKETVVRIAEVSFLVLVGALVVGQALGQPILLSYVTTGSMEPTLEPGDGFVAIPTELAGPIAEGDVVTYDAESLHGGGLTTHRVVGRTEQGYVTRGDANPFTDQDGEEPPVNPAQIEAVAWRPGGRTLVIPHLGTAAMAGKGAMEAFQRRLAVTFGTRSLLGPQGLAYGLFLVTILAYLADFFFGDDASRDRERSADRDEGIDARFVVLAFTLVVVGTATASMVVPGGQQKIGVVASDTASEGIGVVKVGTTESTPYPVPNAGVFSTYVVFETHSERVAVSPRVLTVPRRSTRNVTLSVTAPPENGYYRLFFSEHRYLPLLPRATTLALYRVHPWLPIVVVDALLGVPFYLLGMLVVGEGRIRRRKRGETPSKTVSDRLGRLFG